MASIELLKLNLAIEPDLQRFIGFVVSAVATLGGNPFAATPRVVELSRLLRTDGAATGYPLPACLALDGTHIQVIWGERSDGLVIAKLKNAPAESLVKQLRRHLQQSTEAADPAVLLRRNAEMARYLDETRIRTEKEIELMQQTLAKRQEELHESLRQAETDSLTGLFNRRAFDEKLEMAFRRVSRQGNEDLSLALLDLDFFKQINDTHGHPYGDTYLCKAAQAMLDAIRGDVDMAFRIGGDEFAMLLFANGQTSCKRALEVLKAMSNKVSIGIATFSGNAPTFEKVEDFVRCADKALYQAKHAGRGRVVVCGCQREGFTGCSEYCKEPTKHAKRA